MAGRAEIRVDDLASDPPRHWRFDGLTARGDAPRLDDVVGAVEEAERQADLGHWVVVAVAYESATAFEPAMRTKPGPPAGTPFVSWWAFEHRVDVDPPDEPPQPEPVALVRRPNVMSFPAAVCDVRRRIAAGSVYQVNVTDRFAAPAPVRPDELYAAMLATQASGFGAYIHDGDHVVVSASPELFFRWEADTITCRPMKGTAARRPRPTDDAEAGRALATSVKDQAENVMIVDLLRNDLARLAHPGAVRVPALFTLERYETVWQLTSTVQADVPERTTLVDVFRCLFPCGSVTGAPKIAAMEVIDELELEPRGIYCGAIGLLAPRGHEPRAVFAVPIRTAVIDRDGLTYAAGAGITWASDPIDEDAEVAAKARVITNPWPAFELLETLRLDGEGLRNASLHLERMSASADWFGIPFDREVAVGLLASMPWAAEPRRVRLLLARDGGLRVEATPLQAGAEPVRLAIDTEVTRSDDVFACHKTTARDQYRRALERHVGADDVVLVNERGAATDTTTGNLAYHLDGRWWTPPLADGGLGGIGRRAAIDAGRLTERSIRAADLSRCDELAVLNDLRGWRSAHLVSTRTAHRKLRSSSDSR